MTSSDASLVALAVVVAGVIVAAVILFVAITLHMISKRLDRISRMISGPLDRPGELRPYQQQAIDNIVQNAAEARLLDRQARRREYLGLSQQAQQGRTEGRQ